MSTGDLPDLAAWKRLFEEKVDGVDAAEQGLKGKPHPAELELPSAG